MVRCLPTVCSKRRMQLNVLDCGMFLHDRYVGPSCLQRTLSTSSRCLLTLTLATTYKA
jgi:hypothetical protein